MGLSVGLDFGEKQAVRAVPEKLSAWMSPNDEATQPRFLLGKEQRLQSKQLSLTQEDLNITVSDGNSVYYTGNPPTQRWERASARQHRGMAADAFPTECAGGAGVTQQRPAALDNPSSIPSEAGRGDV